MMEPDEAGYLADVESRLDPARPGDAGIQVLAYGEISATLLLPGLPGRVAKRMSGFPDLSAAQDYRALVVRYCDLLRAGGLSVLPTQPVVVERPRRTPVVYLLQPRVESATLGNHLLHESDDAGVQRLVAIALRQVDGARGCGGDGLEVAIDAQLSNFSFTGGTAALLDVGTPFLREQGLHLLNVRVMLAAVPPGVRELYVRNRTGERYMDDYFDRRLTAVDMLGNFIKEGVADRIPAGLTAADDWLGAGAPITEEEVRTYYDKDAATLELFLRVRRADRWLRTKVLRRPYDFVLPGKVRR